MSPGNKISPHEFTYYLAIKTKTMHYLGDLQKFDMSGDK